jgi:hypothetical protein
MKQNVPVLVLIAIFGSALLSSNAWADGHDSRHGSDRGHREGNGGRDGHWEHGWHDGHLGWLWVVGDALLLYDVTRPAPVPPAPAVIEPTPASVPEPAPGMWYFCQSAGAYYPYVQTCPEGWQAVPATPPPSN